MKKKSAPAINDTEKFVLQLFVSGMSPKSMEAIANIKRICNVYLKDGFELDIVDIYKDPGAAAQHHIVFSPCLIKHSPLPKKTLIGTLSDTEKVVKALGIIIK